MSHSLNNFAVQKMKLLVNAVDMGSTPWLD